MLVYVTVFWVAARMRAILIISIIKQRHTILMVSHCLSILAHKVLCLYKPVRSEIEGGKDRRLGNRKR